MLSYRHGFHAGNAADVFKHASLYAFLSVYTKKDKPFTAFDLNAGAGQYNLLSSWSLKTGEALAGIGAVLEAYKKGTLLEPVPEVFKSFLDYCKKNYEHGFCYAGSPEIIRSFLRGNDELILTELHPAEAEVLKRRYKMCKQVHVHKRDCYKAFFALTPPAVPRGFAFFDPSYEVSSDYVQVAEAVERARVKWRAGSFLVWYPVLKRRTAQQAELKRRLLSLKAETVCFEVKHFAGGFFLDTDAACVTKETVPLKNGGGLGAGGADNGEKAAGGKESTQFAGAGFKTAPESGGYGLQGSGLIIVNPVYGSVEKIAAIASYLNELNSFHLV